MSTLLSATALLLSISGTICINLKYKNGYLCWIASNILWVFIVLMQDTPNYLQTLLYIINTGLSGHGFINWTLTARKGHTTMKASFETALSILNKKELEKLVMVMQEGSEHYLFLDTKTLTTEQTTGETRFSFRTLLHKKVNTDQCVYEFKLNKAGWSFYDLYDRLPKGEGTARDNAETQCSWEEAKALMYSAGYKIM